MQKTLANFFYWLLMKTAESYYGESMQSEELPYTHYFYSNYLTIQGIFPILTKLRYFQ